MGGYGSGRHRGSPRTAVEDCRELDITMFDFDEIPDGGARWRGTATWTSGGEEVASVGTLITTRRGGEDALRLSYTITDTASDDEATEA